ncbi:LysE family translocator [Streptoalloteichus hindustanus]|uniref:Threonine/homoserine/homoserine lactone efflux protein n=1 Tax=Streptoalloteichus hindustanus TaxID=2017 RepID=A0A1M5GCG3_STRHI|nr:LysE family translocator [Streptoalloteichus hindustanus]SHG01386.1 Threonine/homoserine/homoserine lactone efflux protein [Streptoalloteichus hindustanus]
MPELILPFLLVVAVLTVTPGPDWAIVLRNGMRGGASLAWWTGLGCCTGIAAHAAAAVLGLSALLAASATAYTVVKLAGAAYLVYLGVTALWHARRGIGAGSAPAPEVAAEAGEPVTRGAAFRQGVLNNLLNPKIALLFLTLLPQFVAADEPRATTSAVLAVVFLVSAVLWWRVFSFAVGALGRALTRDRVRLTLERLTGGVLVALGVRVALDQS